MIVENNRMTFDRQTLDDAHRHSIRNRSEVYGSSQCGCFYCLRTFPPAEIGRWLTEGDGTAIGPHCDIDAVLGSASSLPVTDEAFLKAMNEHWFSLAA
jgi:hypothetical protein